MDLKMFFDPIEIEVENTSPNSFHSSIYANHGKMPDYSSMDIALIGLGEYRGIGLENSTKSASKIREVIYQLDKGFGKNAVIDLGNLRNGPMLEDTYQRLGEVCSFLIDKGIIPVIFGGSHDLDFGQYLGYELLDKNVSMLNVDSRIDIHSESKVSLNHLNKIFQGKSLFSYHQLGYQSFLVNESELELIDSLGFEAERIGVVKENLKEIEPAIREADFLSFDVSSIKSYHLPGSINSTPFGLDGEEACQICWYAGQNEKLNSIGIYNYDSITDDQNDTGAFSIATMIWYFIEGFYHRKGDKPFISDDYLRYEVHMGGSPESIKFYKSKITERWWMEIPENDDRFNRNRRISCSHSDYEKAQKGEVPDKWLTAMRK